MVIAVVVLIVLPPLLVFYLRPDLRVTAKEWLGNAKRIEPVSRLDLA